MRAGIFSIYSELHDQNRIKASEDLLSSKMREKMQVEWIKNRDFSGYDLIFIAIFTGGCEKKLVEAWPAIKSGKAPVAIIAFENNNSLPAALEIKTWLLQQNPDEKIPILHGTIDRITDKCFQMFRDLVSPNILQRDNIGLIGEPSDWLIGSMPQPEKFKKIFGINQTFISMKEFVNILGHQRVIAGTEFQKKFTGKMSDDELKKAEKVYLALKKTIQNYGLTALSLRCFDILELEKTTGCLALSALNDEGIIAGCEGDMPTAVSMLLAGRLTQKPVFMANPSRVSQNEAVFAHCTVPCTITSEYSLDTHFESGIGVAVSGKFAEGPVTLFKIGAAGQSCAIGEGEILSMPHAADLCRTQARVNMAGIENYLLNNPLGNHQVLIPGHVGKRLEQAASLFGLQQVFQRDFA